MNRKGYLAKLALRERRAGRNPQRVLAAAVSKKAELTPGDVGFSDQDLTRRYYDQEYYNQRGVKRPGNSLVVEYYDRLEGLLKSWDAKGWNHPSIDYLDDGVVTWIEGAASAGAAKEEATGDPNTGWMEAYHILTHTPGYNYGW